MSSISKEVPVSDDVASTPLAQPEEEAPAKTEETTTPTSVDAATRAEAVKPEVSSAPNTAADKTTKLFGSFTSQTTPKKEGEEQKPAPVFGGFKFGSTGASAWSAPSASGGFGASSSFTPKKEENEDDKDEVWAPVLSSIRRISAGQLLMRVRMATMLPSHPMYTLSHWSNLKKSL
jgi:hypothetical protein